MKKLVSLLLAAVMLLCITGCQNNTKSENEIKEEVLSEVGTFEAYDLHVTDFEITNRKTDTEAKIDTVYCSVTAENEVAHWTVDFVVTYRLYDQGWLFEGLKQSNSKVVPIKSNITEEIAKKDFEAQGCSARALDVYRDEMNDAKLNLNLSFDKEELDLENGLHKFYFVDYEAKFMCVLYYAFGRLESFKWSFDYYVDFKTFSQYEADYGPYSK